MVCGDFLFLVEERAERLVDECEVIARVWNVLVFKVGEDALARLHGIVVQSEYLWRYRM